MRDHGTRARYVVEKCRCAPCTEANRAGHAKARRLVAYPSRNGGTAHGRLVCITGARP